MIHLSLEEELGVKSSDVANGEVTKNGSERESTTEGCIRTQLQQAIYDFMIIRCKGCF